MIDPAPRRLWTPGPWEVRAYEDDSAEYEDGFRAWIANHRRKEFVADVLDARNGPLIAAAPRMAAFLELCTARTARDNAETLQAEAERILGDLRA